MVDILKNRPKSKIKWCQKLKFIVQDGPENVHAVLRQEEELSKAPWFAPCCGKLLGHERQTREHGWVRRDGEVFSEERLEARRWNPRSCKELSVSSAALGGSAGKMQSYGMDDPEW